MKFVLFAVDATLTVIRIIPSVHTPKSVFLSHGETIHGVDVKLERFGCKKLAELPRINGQKVKRGTKR